MTFTRPKVGPKVYLSKGPSGHTETFERGSCDRELEMVVGGQSKLHVVIEGFIRKMSLDRKIEGYPDVLAWIAERTGLDVDHIPVSIAIAFWAQVDGHRQAAREAKLTNIALGN